MQAHRLRAHALLIVALLVCGLTALSACSDNQAAAQRPPANLVLISIDALRADHVSAYGYDRPTTPNIDALAAESVLFERAYSHISSTVPAFASVMTSKYPHHHGVIETYNFALSEDENTMAERLRAAGLKTAALLGVGILMPTKGLNQGFETYSVAPFRERDYWLPAPHVTDAALKWLEENHHSRFFLWVHYFEPHQPYDIVPEGYRNRFLAAPGPKALSALRKKPGLYRHRKKIIDEYDGAVAFVDSQVGRLLGRLKEMGLRDRTMLVLTGDHGEGLLEHGLHGHVLQIYEPLVRVPLIIYVPRIRPSRVVDNVEHIDILPTVLHQFGLDVAPSFDGRVLPLDGSAYPPRDAYAETWVSGQGRKVMINDGRWKLIMSDPGFGADERELYDLQSDPGESVNLAAQEYEKTAELEERLLGWMKDYVAGHHFIGSTPAEVEMLKSLGYIE